MVIGPVNDSCDGPQTLRPLQTVLGPPLLGVRGLKRGANERWEVKPEKTGLAVARERGQGRGPASRVWWRMRAGREGKKGCGEPCSVGVCV